MAAKMGEKKVALKAAQKVDWKAASMVVKSVGEMVERRVAANQEGERGGGAGYNNK